MSNAKEGYEHTDEEGNSYNMYENNYDDPFRFGGNGERKGKKKSKPKDDDDSNKEKPKREFPTYKYSKRGTIPLHEAIILDGKPCYIYHDIGIKSFIPIVAIEEETRIIRPPNMEEYQLYSIRV